ncbi:hypothetical protein [Paractinoplanes toevensis]|uniref:hypothetical protein n=1 Tax=Paractinoplanes toevensis TaxID=571911 RepID=UPI001BB42CE3|nr:hypothetical protein [Actinoplanes toevensis]
MRTRRIHRIGPAEAERLVAGDPAGPDLAALKKLLDAARAPAAVSELTGEKAAVAAFRAHRTRAARAARRPARTRVGVVTVATGLALLVLGGTAVAARTGNLPQDAQQHAHRLFSALGVPAPRTGPSPAPTPAPSSSRPVPTRPASPSPSPSPSPDITALGWCEAWRGAPGRTPLARDDRRRLAMAAGGEERIPGFCSRPSPGAHSRSVPPVTPSRSPSRSTSPSAAEPGTRYASPPVWDRASPDMPR